MFYSNFDFEKLEELAIRISSSFFYFLAAYFTAFVTTDVVDMAPSRDILYFLFKLFPAMTALHVGIILALGGSVNRHSFAHIAAAWSAPMLVFLLRGTV